MTHHYAVPGVYIEEVTSPGVIAGVGTSTAAFIGPALRGPMNVARRLTSFDEFQEIYGGMRDNRPWPYLFIGDTPFYLAFAVLGFFANGGREAYIVRVGTGRQSRLPIQNRGGNLPLPPPQPVFVVRAIEEGVAGDQIHVEIQQYAVQEIARGNANIIKGNGTKEIQVDHPELFRAGDEVTDPSPAVAVVTQIQGNRLILSVPLTGSVTITNVGPKSKFRMVSTAGLHTGAAVLISNTNTTERRRVEKIDSGFVTLATPPLVSIYDLAAGPATLTSIRVISRGETTVTDLNQGITVEVADPKQFRPGDIVTESALAANRARIVRMQGNNLILDQPLQNLAVGKLVRIDNIRPGQTTFRVEDTTGLFPGTVVQFCEHPYPAYREYAVIQGVDGTGFVRLEAGVTGNYSMATANPEPVLIPQEFRLIVTSPPPVTGPAPLEERFENLSANPQHPRYILTPRLVTSSWITIESPEAPPLAATYPARLVGLLPPTSPLAGGQNDQPLGLTLTEYQDGLDVLRHVDNVNLVCSPDAAAHPDCQNIQSALINHCLEMGDRFAILDSTPGAPITGPGSIEEQRQAVQAPRGLAALYYPWLMVRHPISTGPQSRPLFIPPSGHLAGVFARVDAERGVHKAPANTEVRGVMGLERILSERQHGPLNLLGINVLRIFPGSRQVTVWGGRTTVDPIITDWLYVNVRRLLLYLEESIEEGIRWAVFEPNNQSLWKKLKRTITEFLTRVWRDGALFGETPDRAFYVRIDEILNPDHVRALGRLYIEIGVRPSYPAEFIIVRIGLWDGGAQISEM